MPQLEERDAERVLAPALARQARAQLREPVLHPPAHRSLGHALTPRDLGRREFLEEAQEQRRAVRFRELDHRAREPLPRVDALDELDGRGQRLGARGGPLARDAASPRAAQSAREVPHDAGEPRPEPAALLGRILERGEPRVLREVVGLALARELPREPAQPRALREQLLRDPGRHRVIHRSAPI